MKTDSMSCIAETESAYTAPNPLDMRWTFGAHEPYTMYRRVGNRSTGGIQGNCSWLDDWFRWWDSEDCPKLMESLGLNWLLCRFYKGMGWEEEKKDFPNVKRFVENCHKHGVKAVAYIQYSTFYPESMGREVPNLMDWAARDPDGRPYRYCGMYFRYEPCPNNPAFEEYLKKMIRIALGEGGFDGVFFDNAYVQACYCPRCEKIFREHLRTIPNPQERFGYDDLSGFGLPGYANKGDFHWSVPWGEVRDPLLQEFNVWRSRRLTLQFTRLREYARSLKPDCVFAANICPYRAPYTVGNKSVDMTEFPKCFDLVMGQVNNCPHVEGDVIVNRVRDLKYAREFPATYFASCDGAAGDDDNEIEDSYLLPLIEDLVFGGVPADRTIMAPCPEKPEFVNHARLERRRPMLAAFNAFAKEHRGMFAARDWLPVRFLVSQYAMMHSQLSQESLMAAEGAALRGHVPFGYSISTETNPLPHAGDAIVIVVANQTCLSDWQISALVDYAKKGGRLVCTGESGRYDEWNRQRFGNPLKDAVAGFPNVVWRNDYDTAKVKRMTHIEYAIHPPDKGVRPLLGDIAKTGWCPEVEVLSAPETVFAQFKLGPDGKVNAVHLLNYVFLKPVSGVRLRLPAGIVPCFAAPFDETPSAGFPREVLPCVWEMPVFTRYAFCALKAPPFSLAGESQYVFPGKTSDLQALIDEASAAGGGVVTVSPGVHELRPIALKSGVTLRLERGAVLQASANLADYAARDGSPVLVGAFDATNVAVVGEGVIDGRGSFFKEKDGLPGESQPVATPVLMRLSRCCGVRLEGFTFRDAAAWGVHLRNCDGVQVRRVKAFCHVNKSNDGIDVESRNVLIGDCDLDTDDDALVFKSESDPAFAITNVAVRNCRLASCCNAIKFGTGSYGLWRDIDVHDCVVTRAARTWRFDWRKPSREHPVPSDAFPKPMPGVTNAVTGLAAIALEVVDGGRMENVRVRNIDIQSGFQTPIFIRMERRHPPMDDVPTCMRDVLIENVKGTAESRIACSITGLPYVRPTGITLRNVSLRFPGGGTAEDAVKVPRECEADYPDNYMFDQEALPAWGFYIRHADDIRFENVSLSLLSPDARPKIVREDVKDFLWDGHKVD